MPLHLRLLSVTVFRATRSWKDTLQERGAVCGRYPHDACTAAASRRSGIFGLCHGTWLICFGNTLKIYAFYPNFPLAGSVIGGFYWLFLWLCLSLWLIQDSNWKGRVLWKLSGGLATILQNWISCNEQKMREAHITRRGMNFYLLIFIEKIINRKIEHSHFFGTSRK